MSSDLEASLPDLSAYSYDETLGSSTIATLLSGLIAVSTTDDPSVNYTAVAGSNVQFQLYDYLIPAFGIIIIVLNLAVVISSGLILKGGAQPRTTYLFLGNVAMADLVTSVATLFGQFYPREWRGEMTCILQMGMIVSSTLASIWSVLLIGIDRFFYIVHGLKYQQWLTPRRARWLIVCTWMIGLIIGFMPAMGWIGWTNGGKYCWFIRLAPHGLVILIAAVGFLPIIIITILYSIILYHALRKIMQLRRADYEAAVRHVPDKEAKNTGQMRIFRGGQSINENPENKRKSPKKFKAVMIVVLTTGSFVVTWVPFFIASIMYVICEIANPDGNTCKPLRLAIASPLAILGFLNSLLNPLIYAWWHKGFRAFVCTKILRKKRAQNKGSTTSRMTRKSTTISNSSTKTTGSISSTNQNSRQTTHKIGLGTIGDSDNKSGPTRKISKGVTEGPYICENEDTHL